MTREECISTYGNDYTDYCMQYPKATPGESLMGGIGDFFSGIFSNFLLVLLVIFVIVLVSMSIKIIRQQEVGVVERLGRYNRSIGAGFHMIIPFFEKIAHDVNLELQRIDVSSDIKTKDDQMITLPVVVIIKVNDEKPEQSVYVVEEPYDAITALVSNEVKARAALMTLEEIYEDRDSIKASVAENLTEKITSYGFVVDEVVIDNPVLSDEMRQAYNRVAQAEKAKQAATAEGEALKIKKVAEAEANGASLEIQGKAYVINRDKIAEGNAAALKKLIGESDLTAAQALHFLTVIDTNDAVRDSAASGATVVVATGDSSHANLGMIAAS